MELISPTQVVRQASVKMAASSTAPRRTEQLVDDAPQGPCAVFLNGIDSGAAHPHVGQHGIHQRQNGSGEDTCQNGVPHPIPLFRHAEGTQRGSNDQSGSSGRRWCPWSGSPRKSPSGRGQHHRPSGTGPRSPLPGTESKRTGNTSSTSRLGVRKWPMRFTSFPVSCTAIGPPERTPASTPASTRWYWCPPAIGGHRHLKGNRGGTGDAKTGPDGEIDQQGKDDGEALAHLLPQPVQPVKAGHDHHPQHRQHHRRGQKAQHGRQGVAPGVLPQKGREDQVPAPKNRENSIKLTSSILFLLSFMSILLIFQKFAKKDPSQISLRRVLLYNTRGTTQIARRKTSCHFRLYQALCTYVAYTESPTDRCVGGLGSEGIRVLALSAGLPPSPALYATCCQLRLRHRF